MCGSVDTGKNLPSPSGSKPATSRRVRCALQHTCSQVPGSWEAEPNTCTGSGPRGLATQVTMLGARARGPGPGELLRLDRAQVVTSQLSSLARDPSLWGRAGMGRSSSGGQLGGQLLKERVETSPRTEKHVFMLGVVLWALRGLPVSSSPHLRGRCH